VMAGTSPSTASTISISAMGASRKLLKSRHHPAI
jgi:hypothetical protein